MQHPPFSPNPSRVQELLSICPAHGPTPLVRLAGIIPGEIFIKDESNRMGLGSFKALGGVYAVARLILDAWEQQHGSQIGPSDLLSPPVLAFASQMTFVCASAGNHGLSVAAGAKLFGAKARIHLAESVPTKFAETLRSKGAQVVWSGDVYEESLVAASRDAEDLGAILLADGSWPGYVGPPSLVMEGYTVLAEELRAAFEKSGEWPTHVILQAGVGGLAAAVAHMVRETWTVQPKLIIVEPEQAPCLKESHKAGRRVRVEGLISNMGRLDCKEVSMVAFETLERCDVDYVTITDTQASQATAALLDHDINTTPSGAAGYAFIQDASFASGARPLAIVSEGFV
jgi:diaminopropionate ammonia-lyase